MRLTRAPIAAVILLTTGCAGWRQVAVTPQAVAESPDRIRVTRTDGSRVVIRDAEVTADTLHGTGGGGPVRMPFDSVARIAVPETSKSQTEAGWTVAATAVLAAALAWVILIVASD